MVFDQPHIYEIEDMLSFAGKYKHIFIYGCADNQEYLLKFLDICGVTVEGYITSYQDYRELRYRTIPKYTLDAVDLSDSGIIIGAADKYYDGIIPLLRKRGFTDYFVMSEYNKRTIAHKLRPRPRENMWIEINLVDHCNLNCQMCDHFSQLAPPFFLSADEFRRDMTRLAELSSNSVAAIKLIGGEPLLHKEVNSFIEITRELFPASKIVLYTNGLLLLKAEHNEPGNFWQSCKDNDVTVDLTTYPVNIDIEAIEKLAQKYDVKINIFSNVADGSRGIKTSTKHPFDLDGHSDSGSFISCYQFNECIVLRHGRLYTCPVIPYSQYFNEAFEQNLHESEDDSIDIYAAKSYDELAEFAAKRVPFCAYCDVKNRTHGHKWRQSSKTIDEYLV